MVQPFSLCIFSHSVLSDLSEDGEGITLVLVDMHASINRGTLEERPTASVICSNPPLTALMRSSEPAKGSFSISTTPLVSKRMKTVGHIVLANEQAADLEQTAEGCHRRKKNKAALKDKF